MDRFEMIQKLSRAGYKVYAELTSAGEFAPDAKLAVFGDGRWVTDHSEIVELLSTGINAITPEPV